MQKSLLIFKPDVYRRNLDHTILSLIIADGLKVTSWLYMPNPPRTKLEQHYVGIKDKPYFQKNLDFMTSGPISLLSVQGENAVARALAIRKAVRTTYVTDPTENLLHASDSPEEATRELALWGMI